MKNNTPIPREFEPEFIDGLRSIFEEKIVFNQVLGLKIETLRPELATARIDMRPDLVGHFAYNRVHGDVIAARSESYRHPMAVDAMRAGDGSGHYSLIFRVQGAPWLPWISTSRNQTPCSKWGVTTTKPSSAGANSARTSQSWCSPA